MLESRDFILITPRPDFGGEFETLFSLNENHSILNISVTLILYVLTRNYD